MKKTLHPRNRHRDPYDFKQLVECCPELSRFVSLSPTSEKTIDFADPIAVRLLNRALLKHFYGVENWELPPGYLCPPIPGRADLIHLVADLLGHSNGNKIPKGKQVRILDVGVGSSCIYPLIGQNEYQWSFVGSDVDPQALASAQKIVDSNAGLAERIELRLQASPKHVYSKIVRAGEVFALAICNPPFHSSLEEAQEGSRRKWRNLGKAPASKKAEKAAPKLNFGGQGSELWCPGGEVALIRKMISESVQFSRQCLWFSTLVSKEANLPAVEQALKAVRPSEVRLLVMTQGQKKSRIVAWTFTDQEGQKEFWKKYG